MTIKKFYSNEAPSASSVHYISGQNSGSIPEPQPINTKIHEETRTYKESGVGKRRASKNTKRIPLYNGNVYPRVTLCKIGSRMHAMCNAGLILVRL